MKTRSHNRPSETVDRLLRTAFFKIGTAIDREQATLTTLLDTDAQSSAIANSLETSPDSSSQDLIDLETSGSQKSETPDLETESVEDVEKPEPTHDSGQTNAVQAPNQVQGLLIGIRAEEIMRTNITWASPDDTIQDVITKMGEHNIHYMAVGNDGKMEGLVSRSSVNRTIGTYLRPEFINQRVRQDDATLSFKLNWKRFKIKWTMNQPVHTIKPDLNLSDAMALMCEFQVRCLPVVNDEEQVLGMVTESDIFQKLRELSTSVP